LKISTRGRYGVRALLDLALCEGNKPVALKDIAQRQHISLSYLEQLISSLVSAGLVHSTRGPRGGVWLAKLPEEINLSDVIQPLEGSIAPVECVDNPKVCAQSESCITRNVWDEVKRAITGALESITLQDLAERCYLQRKQP